MPILFKSECAAAAKPKAIILLCIIEHFGNADAKAAAAERCLSRKAEIMRCCPLSFTGQSGNPVQYNTFFPTAKCGKTAIMEKTQGASNGAAKGAACGHGVPIEKEIRTYQTR